MSTMEPDVETLRLQENYSKIDSFHLAYVIHLSGCVVAQFDNTGV